MPPADDTWTSSAADRAFLVKAFQERFLEIQNDKTVSWDDKYLRYAIMVDDFKFAFDRCDAGFGLT